MNFVFAVAVVALCQIVRPSVAPEPRVCYECTSGPNDGCDDPARLAKWATDCPPGTQGCLKMKAPGSPLVRSCGNPPDSPVPIKDGCVNKPGVGIICSCSSGNLCNNALIRRGHVIPLIASTLLLLLL